MDALMCDPTLATRNPDLATCGCRYLNYFGGSRAQDAIRPKPSDFPGHTRFSASSDFDDQRFSSVPLRISVAW